MMFTQNQGLFSFPCSASEQKHWQLGGSIARTAARNKQEVSSCPRMSCSIYKQKAISQEELIRAQGWAGHQSAGGEQLLITCLSWVLFFFLLFLFMEITIIIF